MQNNPLNETASELRPPGLSLWIGVSIFLHFCLTCALVNPISTRPPKLSWELGNASIDAYFVQATSAASWVPLEKQSQPQNQTPQVLATNDSVSTVDAPLQEAPAVSLSKTVETESLPIDLPSPEVENVAAMQQFVETAPTEVVTPSQGNQQGSVSTISSVAQHGGLGGQEPSALTCPLPRYPKWAREQGITGTVLLDMLVDERGRPQDIRIAKSSGYVELDEAARTTAKKQWRFTPAMSGNKPIAQRITVGVQFALN